MTHHEIDLFLRIGIEIGVFGNEGTNQFMIPFASPF